MPLAQTEVQCGSEPHPNRLELFKALDILQNIFEWSFQNENCKIIKLPKLGKAFIHGSQSLHKLRG